MNRIEGQNDPRGTIVAGVNDRDEPFVGIVVAGFDGPHGEDVWRVLDVHGETIDVRCTQVPVIDEERMGELRQALADHESKDDVNYVVITRPRYARAGREPEPAIRTAVATLEAARAAVQQAICDNDPDYDADLLNAVDALPESGGTVGPLPDGTVFEVRPITDDQLRAAVAHKIDGAHTRPMAEIRNAYNERTSA